MKNPFFMYEQPQVRIVGDKIYAGEVSLFWSLVYGINVFIVLSTVVSFVLENYQRDHNK